MSRRYPYLLLLILTLVTYLPPLLQGGFIWDDDDHVTENLALRSAKGLKTIWTHVDPPVTPQYYPLTFTAFWLQYRAWGDHPAGYHAINVLLQAINAMLLFRLLRGLRVPGAWWAAAVFAVHPVNVMSVAWITELKNVLAGFFMLASALAFFRAEGITGEPVRSRAPLLVASFLLFVAALLSKAASGVLPILLLLVPWWKKGRLGVADALRVLPFAGAAAGMAWLNVHIEQSTTLGTELVFSLGGGHRILLAAHAFWIYLGHLLWPVHLIFFYPQWPLEPHRVLPWLPWVGLVLVVAALWRARRRCTCGPLVAALWFFLAGPAVALVQELYMMRYTYVADHWQYFCSPAAIAALVAAGARGAERRRLAKPARWSAGAVVLALFAAVSFALGSQYRDAETLFTRVLRHSSCSWMAYNNLGVLSARRGDLAAAEQYFRMALQCDSRVAPLEANLGNICYTRGQLEQAVAHYRRALQLNPTYVGAHNNLGSALANMGRMQEARRAYDAALRIRPGDYDTLMNQGVLAWQQGRLEDALDWYRQAARANELASAPLLRAADVLATSGRFDAAEDALRAALAVDGRNPVVQRQRARVLDLRNRAAYRASPAGPD